MSPLVSPLVSGHVMACGMVGALAAVAGLWVAAEVHEIRQRRRLNRILRVAKRRPTWLERT